MNKGISNQEFKPLIVMELKNVKLAIAINTSFHVNPKLQEETVPFL